MNFVNFIKLSVTTLIKSFVGDLFFTNSGGQGVVLGNLFGTLTTS